MWWVWHRVPLSVAAFLALCAAISLTVALNGPPWLRSRLRCPEAANLVNASQPHEQEAFTGWMVLGPWQGSMMWQCGLGPRYSEIQLFPELVWQSNPALHLLSLSSAVLGGVFDVTGTALALWNIFGSPTFTIAGPAGIYLCLLLSVVFPSMSLILLWASASLAGLMSKVANAPPPPPHPLVPTGVQAASGTWLVLVGGIVPSLLAALSVWASGMPPPLPRAQKPPPPLDRPHPALPELLY
uniref:clarin-2-like n=1 Tax=Myxine glutinosa TaxID=7769 RepID=UPI00358E1D4A